MCGLTSHLQPESNKIGIHSPSDGSFVEYPRLKQPQDHKNDADDENDGEEDNEPTNASRSSLFLVVPVEP